MGHLRVKKLDKLNLNLDSLKSCSETDDFLSADSEYSTSIQTDCEIGDEEDYGYFDKIEENIGIPEDITALLTPRVLTSPISIDKIKTKTQSIICELQDNTARLSCRSFQSNCSHSELLACTSITGIRIVQDDCGLIAEYRVKLVLNSTEYFSWKKYSDFKNLGDACMNYCRGRMLNFDNYWNNPNPMKKTLITWERVVKHRPWLNNVLKAEFLIKESGLLENFIKQFLFEIPCIDMLTEFMIDD